MISSTTSLLGLLVLEGVTVLVQQSILSERTVPVCTIRALADMNSDGRMDIHEFSIAMKLIKLKLQGHPLPPSLPPSMKQPPLPLPPQTSFGKTNMEHAK